MDRGAFAEVDLGAIAHNLGAIRKKSGGRSVIAVVKADAYGHGAVPVARTLAAAGVDCFAVAYTQEAVVLREAGITAGILVFFDRGPLDDYFDYDLTPVVSDLTTAGRLSAAALSRGRSLDVHVKVDTGMGRLGLGALDFAGGLEALVDMKGLRIAGLMSHFSEADIGDRSYAAEQLQRFSRLKESLTARLGRPVPCHMANSAATLSLPLAHFDAVRSGIALYGSAPFGDDPAHFGLMPAMTVRTTVHSVRRVPAGTPISYGRTFVTGRESLIAVLPVGYADGYFRRFSNNAEVLIRGTRAPVVGRICMDLTMVDGSAVPGIAENDEVVLLGQQGGERITACELARRADTISYEILTSLGSRSRRTFLPADGRAAEAGR